MTMKTIIMKKIIMKMKRTQGMAIGTLLLFGVSGAAAQSLGDYARAVRKNKPEPSSTSRHFDNDNLPTNESLSVVGPPPSSDAGPANAKTATAAPSTSAIERQKASDEWKKKLDQQKQKIESLNHELDLDQRELHLRDVQANADPTLRLRDGGQWDKDDAHYKSEIDEKQKALDTARQQLDDLQDQAHKAGIAQDDKDKDSNKDNTTKDNNQNK
jgi:hypothetical protein